MRKITDRQGLTAARRVLATHLSLRPANCGERAAIANAHEAAARLLAAAASRARALGHVSSAIEFDRRAANERMHANAWMAATDSTWEETRAALAARVAFYEARVAGAAARVA